MSKHFVFHDGQTSLKGPLGEVEYQAYMQLSIHSRSKAFQFLETLVHQLKDEKREDFMFLFAGEMGEIDE